MGQATWWCWKLVHQFRTNSSDIQIYRIIPKIDWLLLAVRGNLSETEEDGAFGLKFTANAVNNEQFWDLCFLEAVIGCDLCLWGNYNWM